MKILILSIGDELIYGNRTNTTGPEISYTLSSLGFDDIELITIGDSKEKIKHFVTHTRANIIITTGGLGATKDDFTVEAVANALGLDLIPDDTHTKRLNQSLKAKFKKKLLNFNFDHHFKKIREHTLKQALYPKGTTQQPFFLETNPYGSAGFIYSLPPSFQTKKSTSNKQLKRPAIFLLPGVPGECIPLLKKKVIPHIKKLTHITTVSLSFILLNTSETVTEAELQSLLNGESSTNNKKNTKNTKKKFKSLSKKIKIAFLPSHGELLVRITAPKNDKKDLQLFIQTYLRQFSQQYPSRVIYKGDTPLSKKIHQTFIKHRLKVGFVESCSGGLLTSEFVQHAGSSTYLDSSIVTYTRDAKINYVNVKPNTLKKHGEVSGLTAEEMAIGHAKQRKLHLSVSITGISGPGGSTKTKPIGLAYVGLYFAKCLKSQEFHLREHTALERNSIRKRVVKKALILIAETLKKYGYFK